MPTTHGLENSLVRGWPGTHAFLQAGFVLLNKLIYPQQKDLFNVQTHLYLYFLGLLLLSLLL